MGRRRRPLQPQCLRSPRRLDLHLLDYAIDLEARDALGPNQNDGPLVCRSASKLKFGHGDRAGRERKHRPAIRPQLGPSQPHLTQSAPGDTLAVGPRVGRRSGRNPRKKVGPRQVVRFTRR